ncbi:hypothetical protein [Sulfuriroseicoccus oceanibius]|uniref:Uncharacterized protein n=1 Tax=Sulfuriroseicoccus oceanibius TaxID=2707525 RepID=A0A6B3L6K6_9BACT|nr:hypothetical protein [Sulfuriroseicoccus oceanibius]QQL46225.1 hypothetical protein G3M56_006485 [Sulfuriroseicoccus oceanibius]
MKKLYSLAVAVCLSLLWSPEAAAAEEGSLDAVEWLDRAHVLIGKWESTELVGLPDGVESFTIEFFGDGSVTTVIQRKPERVDGREIAVPPASDDRFYAVGNGVIYMIMDDAPAGQAHAKRGGDELFNYELNGGNLLTLTLKRRGRPLVMKLKRVR